MRLFVLSVSALVLTGCNTVKMPNIDALKLSNFREETAKLQANTPSMQDAPRAPTDIRSDAEWDRDVQALITTREGFAVPQSPDVARSQAEIDADYARLKSQVQAYKLDDPQE